MASWSEQYSLSSAAERIGRQAAILQALGRSVVSAAAVPDEQASARGGGVRAGAGAVPPTPSPSPSRRVSSEPSAAASRRPADADAAAAPSPPPRRLTAEMALSILVDCFGH